MIGIIWFSSLSTLPSDPGRRAGRILRVKEDHDVLTMKCNGKSRILRSGLRMTGRDGTNRAGRVITEKGVSDFSSFIEQRSCHFFGG